MPPNRVDFYLLASENSEACWPLACRLVEKAYLRGHRLYIHCQNQQQAELLDELLWTFKDDSFIPHNLQGEGPEPPPPIQIGYANEPRGFEDILLNLADEVPSFYQKFQRVMELVVNNPSAKDKSREHYRLYRTQQWQIHTHQIA